MDWITWDLPIYAWHTGIYPWKLFTKRVSSEAKRTYPAWVRSSLIPENILPGLPVTSLLCVNLLQKKTSGGDSITSLSKRKNSMHYSPGCRDIFKDGMFLYRIASQGRIRVTVYR